MDSACDLGVQSYCFRGFNGNEQVADLVKQCGLSKIELCGVHADFTDLDTFDEVIAGYRDAGVDIVSIGVQSFSDDEDVEADFFEFARRVGAGVITADFALDSVPASFRTVERLAERYDINVAIHNHGGRHWLGNATALRWVFSKTSTRVGLSLDTGWALDSREDPVAWIREFGERVHLLHLKDFTFGKDGGEEEAILGSGNLDLPATAAALSETGFKGLSIIEYEGAPDNPVPPIKECVAAVRGQLSDFFD